MDTTHTQADHQAATQSDATENAQPASPITARMVPDAKRLAFLPLHFGDDFLRFERMLYFWAGRLCVGYSGGWWNFYTLSNGGVYVALETTERLRIVADNDYDGTMSADAAGVVISMYALNILSCDTCDDRITGLYYRLRAFALEHAEARDILQAID